MSTLILGSANNNTNIDGAINLYSDNGGFDTYVVLPAFATAVIPANPPLPANTVSINDASGGTIVLGPGTEITSFSFSANGVQMVIGNNTLRFNGDTGLTATMVTIGADPFTGVAGRTISLADLAVELGATVPAVGQPAVTVPGGTVQPDNTISDDPVDPIPGDAIILTEFADIETGNFFSAPRGFTPGGTDQVNTLDDDDVLTGTGDNPTLNFTFVDDADIGTPVITPTLIGIETVNVSVQGNANKTLDFQDTTGMDNLNISRINATNQFNAINIAETVSNFSINSSSNQTAVVNFLHLTGVLAGDMDETTLTLNSANLAAVTIDNSLFAPATEGYETVNLDSVGSANSIGVFSIQGAETLNITGDQDLRLGTTGSALGPVSNNQEATNFGGGLAGVFGFLDTVDASTFTGDLTYHINNEVNAASSANSGAPVNFTALGGLGDDTFILNNGAIFNGLVNDTDVIDGNEGANTVVAVGNSVINAAATPTIRNVQNLEVRTGHDLNAAPDVVTIDADAFDSLENIFIRNEGQDFTVAGGVGAIRSVAEDATVNLNNLTAVQGTGLTVAHGTTGNNGVADLILNASLASTAGDDTVGVELVNGLNTDTRFNFVLNATGAVENITLTDSDTESNTVALLNFAAHNGTITLNGGAAGQFMNLDAGAPPPLFTNSGIYGLDIQGSPSTNVPPAADAVAGTADVAVAAAGLGGLVDSASAVAGLVIRDGLPIGGDVRLVADTIEATDYLGNVIVRLGENVNPIDVTVNTGVGNDTIIFDTVAVGAVQLDSAGLSSADRVNTGLGFDTVVIDGESANPIILDPTEFSQFSGVDAVRLVSNATVANVGNADVVAADEGGYRIAISNELIQQTDSGNRLLFVNNDGDLNTNIESDLVLNMRNVTGDQLDATNSRLVTFVGANGNGAPISSNRLQLSESSATNGMILDGGDTDVGALNGNNNVYEVFGSANLTINDLQQTSNFGRVELSNANAPLTTSTISLNDATVDRLVDTSGSGIERLAVVANNTFNPVGNGVIGVQQINVNAATLSANFALDVVLGGGLNNVNTGAGNDNITFTGNYNNAQGLLKPDIAVGQNGAVIAAEERATGINQFGLDGIAATADDADAQLVYTGTVNGNAGNDIVNVYGAANLAAVTFTGIEAFNFFSNVTITAAQAALAPITIGGAGDHVLTILDDGSGPVDLSNITYTGGGVLTINNPDGLTYTDVVDNQGMGPVEVEGLMLVGDGGNNTIVGTSGDDNINGGGGSDTLTDGPGVDVVVGGDGNDTINLVDDGDADVFAGLAGNDTINIGEMSGGLSEIHFRSIDGTDTVNGLDLTTGRDFIAFLNNGAPAGGNGSVDFAQDDEVAGAFGTRFDAGDTGASGDATFSHLGVTNLADFQTVVVALDSNKVIQVGGNNSVMDVMNAMTANALSNSYVVASDDGMDTQIYFDADWTNTAGRVQIAELVGVAFADVDVTDFGVYTTLAA